MASTPKVAKVFRPQVTPEAASSFISPSKSRGKDYYSKKTIEKTTYEKVGRICGKSTKIPWLGTTFKKTVNIVNIGCMYIDMALRMPKMTFEHIRFQCRTHRGKNLKVVKDNIWK